MSATPLYLASGRMVTQNSKICSLIQTEAQTYRILPIIPNPASSFSVTELKAGLKGIEDSFLRTKKHLAYLEELSARL